VQSNRADVSVPGELVHDALEGDFEFIG